MVESIKELKKICQDIKFREGTKIGNFHRHFSIYLTKFLLYTKVTPTMVSVFRIILWWFSCILILIQDIKLNILGFILIYFSFLLDRVDGELARYKNTCSLKGSYIDEINHLLNPAFLIIAFTLNIYFASSSIPILLLGILAALFTTYTHADFNIQYATISKMLIYPLYHSNFSKIEEDLNRKEKGRTRRKLGLIIYFFKSLFILMLVLFVSYLTWISTRRIDLIVYILAAYTFFIVLAYTIQAYRNYKNINTTFLFGVEQIGKAISKKSLNKGRKKKISA